VALLLREDDVEQVIEMDSVIEAVETAMRELGQGIAQNEPRRRAFGPGGLLNVMFASFPGGKCTGLKAYTVAGGKVRFLVLMFGPDGVPTAMIEADLMGAYRTGAASAVAARALAPPGRVRLAIIGSGYQARTQALALSRVLKLHEIRVFSRNAGRRSSFASNLATELGVHSGAAPTARDALRGAQVVVTITTSDEPVIEASWVEPGALVIAAGSNFSHRAEIPVELVARATTVVVDQLTAARLESGDLLQAEAAGYFTWDRALELGEVVANGWQMSDERGIKLFESHGLALWDLAAGTAVLAAAKKRHLGMEVPLFSK
jgi:alanine dehydrogenase